MAPHLSPQLRERIVAWRYEHGKSAREIAELADCSERTIYDILRLHRDFGQTSNPFARQNARPRSLELDDIHYICWRVIRLILFTGRTSSSLPTMEPSWNLTRVILPSNHGILMELDARHPPFQPWNPHGTQIRLILFTRHTSSSLPTMESSWNSMCVILPSNHGTLMELDVHHPPFQPWNPHGTQIRLILFTRRASSSLPTMEPSWNSV
ncbi:hypothetical protein F4604DRAFT_1916155 [Suillus subluteus]|nr:hypothetical protein F4604DRAFT_1916155 [Suillus subluteus]